MLFENVHIMGLSYIDPPNIVTSSELEDELKDNLQRFKMRPNLIEDLTGIKTRRTFGPGLNPSIYATQTAVRALEDARLPKEKVGLLINCSISKDYIEPSVAAMIHGNLNLPSECLNFDISNACLGFLNGMEIAGNMIERGQIDYALLTSCESSEDLMRATLRQMKDPEIGQAEFRDRFATLTLGSGSTAMVLAHKKHAADKPRFLGGVSRAATQFNQLCVGHNEDMKTDAKTLLIAGTQLALETYAQAKAEMGWDKKEFQHYMMHQVGKAHLGGLIQAINVPADRVPMIFPEYGNTGSTTIPLALAKSVENGLVKKGDRVALMGIGSGINCSMMEIEW